MLIIRSRKQQMMKEIKLPNQEKNQKAWRKGKLEVVGNIGSGHHQTSGDERKKF